MLENVTEERTGIISLWYCIDKKDQTTSKSYHTLPVKFASHVRGRDRAIWEENEGQNGERYNNDGDDVKN